MRWSQIVCFAGVWLGCGHGGQSARDDGAAGVGTRPRPARLRPLSKADIIAGMNAVKPRVQDCLARYQQRSVATVRVKIAETGRVAAVEAGRELAGTPAGSCVEDAVRAAEFPPNSGTRLDYPYPPR